MTLGEAAGYMGDIGPGVLLAPVKGLGTGLWKREPELPKKSKTN